MDAYPLAGQFGLRWAESNNRPNGPSGSQLTYPTDIDVEDEISEIMFSHTLNSDYEDYNGTKTDKWWDYLPSVLTGEIPWTVQIPKLDELFLKHNH